MTTALIMNRSAMKVLDTLRNASDETGARLSVRELTEITGFSESTVRRTLKLLAEIKAIVIGISQGITRNGGITNCYRVTPPLSKNDTPSVISDDRPSVKEVTPPLSFPMIDPLSSEFDKPEISSVEYVSAHSDAATRVNNLSLKAKAKGKRQKTKAKDKNISPDGESVLPPDSNNPEPVNHREIHTAVCDAFKVKPGGFVGMLAQQLLGTASKGKRQEYAIAPAMTAVEVVAFGQWYREVFGVTVKVPTTAETLQERVTQFRDDTTRHAKKMAISEQRLARLMQPSATPEVSPAKAQQPAPVEREGTLKSSDMLPVQESEVAGYVKAGLMTADEFPRPTMKTIFDRVSQRMGSNHNAARIE